MILCLNIGNAHILGGVFNGDDIKLRFRRKTDQGETSDQLGIFLKSVLRENDIDPRSISKIACCSVAPFIDYSLKAACLKYFHQQPFMLRPGIKTGLKIKYSNPLEVGANRIANAIAALHYFPNRDIIIADFGTTATVFCAINNNKEYLGGVILPGLPLAMDALQERAAKLPPVEIIKPNTMLGRSTVESIQAGLYYSQLGAAREIIANFEHEAFANQPTKNTINTTVILATGNFAYLFIEENLFTDIAPDLSLQGLRLALLKNEL